MINEVRSLERVLGDGIKRLETNELETVVVQRRSLFWSKDLKTGEVITKKCIKALRPCPKNALKANELDKLIGKIIKKDVKNGDMIKKEEIDF